MRKLAVFAAFYAGTVYADSNPPLLLQKPGLSKTQIVFVYAGDLWTVPREGGDARRLTSGPRYRDQSCLFAGWRYHRIHRRVRRECRRLHGARGGRSAEAAYLAPTSVRLSGGASAVSVGRTNG